MKTDLMVAEIGSTTTVVNAFNIKGDPVFVGQGQYRTTVYEGDVNIGLKGAIEDLRKNLSAETVDYDVFLASSSAAGGLKMTVHGLVYDMTAKAAREAALGAGANIKLVTAGKLRRTDLAKIKEISPNIILLAGGVDFGERDTAIYNAELIRSMNLDIPVIYAGNIENQEEMKLIFENQELYLAENVYPRIDELNIEPTRKIIQQVFEKHIVHAKGMEEIRKMVTGKIIPTPGAVMEASILLNREIGDLVTVDIGGATTDVHSVCEDSDEYSRILMDPEPRNKRTVEGDLGMYVSRHNVLDLCDREKLSDKLGINVEELEKRVENLNPIPENKDQVRLVEELATAALETALKRHAGKIRNYYGPSGKRSMASGKDLTGVKYFIGTGGALTRLPSRIEIIKNALNSGSEIDLLPSQDTEILIDNHYIMASLGVMAEHYEEAALSLMKKSLGIESCSKAAPIK